MAAMPGRLAALALLLVPLAACAGLRKGPGLISGTHGGILADPNKPEKVRH
jgi:hypothetical protein